MRAVLACPHCGSAFSSWPREGALQCEQGHSFDIARQGYVSMLPGRGSNLTHDSAAMVAARSQFLGAGHYRPLAEAIVGIAAGQVVLDAGTGTGYYLRALLDSRTADAVAIDISKFALRRAARTNPEAIHLACSLWDRLPLAGRSIDLILNVFSPRNPNEFARVLKPGGRLLVVTPEPDHLAEIAEVAGLLSIEEDKQVRLLASLAESFEPEVDRGLVVELKLSRRDVANVALMGPAGHHLNPAELNIRLETLTEPVRATARFRVQTFVRD